MFIQVSTDCGQSWKTLYANGGADMQTRSDVSSVFIPKPSEWKQDTVDLSAYAGLTSGVALRFSGKNDLGNNFFLDNVLLGDRVVASENETETREGIAIYPNPATNSVVVTSRRKIEAIQLLDLSGKKVLEQSEFTNTEAVTLDISSLKAGIYFIETLTAAGRATHRLVIK
jgi:hypothetical protein